MDQLRRVRVSRPYEHSGRRPLFEKPSHNARCLSAYARIGLNSDPFVNPITVIVQESATTAEMKAAHQQLFQPQEEQNRNQGRLGVDINRATGIRRPVRVRVTDDDGGFDGAAHPGSAARAMLYGERLVQHHQLDVSPDLRNLFHHRIGQFVERAVEQVVRPRVFDSFIGPLHDELDGMNQLNRSVGRQRGNYVRIRLPSLDDEGLPRFLALSDLLRA